MSSLPVHRLVNRKPAVPRTNVCPPDVVPRRDSLWTAARRWLAGGDAAVAPALRTPLERARGEFVAALDGLPADDPNGLLERAQRAHSLRDLWHLRSELYTFVARRAGQAEADARLARVNRHFPTRPPAPRSADVH